MKRWSCYHTRWYQHTPLHILHTKFLAIQVQKVSNYLSCI